MIVVTLILSILNQIDFHLVQNQKQNCHHDHIPFNLKGNGILVFSVYNAEKVHPKILPRSAEYGVVYYNQIIVYIVDDNIIYYNRHLYNRRIIIVYYISSPIMQKILAKVHLKCRENSPENIQTESCIIIRLIIYVFHVVVKGILKNFTYYTKNSRKSSPIMQKTLAKVHP